MNDTTKKIPSAKARIKGAPKYSNIRGNIYFYDTYGGSIIVAEIYGIPGELETASKGFLGFHIHSGDACTGTAADAFADTDGHYNPGQKEHPEHAGDLPVLLISGGIAWMAVYTGRFYPEDVVGRTAVVHAMPDDYRSQPAGGSGEKIACGVIEVGEAMYH